MIELEVTDSPDKEILGKRTFYFDEITIGRKAQHTLIMLDPELKDREFDLCIVDNGVELKEGTQKTVYAKGDVIHIGQSCLKILSWEKSEPPEEDLATAYKKILEEHPEWEDLFKALEQELIHLEGQIHV